MIHHGQRLAFGLESRHDFFGVHPKLDDFEGNTATHRFLLVGNITPTPPPSTILLRRFEVAILVPGPSVRGRRVALTPTCIVSLNPASSLGDPTAGDSRNVPASSCAFSRDSTCARKSPSPAQALSR